MNSTRSRSFAAVVVTAALLVTPARSARADEPGEGRVLAGHTFMPSATVSQPFTTTSLGSTMVLGMGTTTGTVNVGDTALSGSFDYAGIGAGVAYEHAWGNRWSARFEISDFIYSGISGKSALAIGTSVQVGARTGFTYGWSPRDDVRFGLLLDAFYAPNMALTLATGINSIIEQCNSPAGCAFDSGKIFGTTYGLWLQPAASVAYAPSSSIGLTGTVTWLHAWFWGAADGTGDAISVAGAFDYDFKATTSVPIGLQVLLNWTGPIGNENIQRVTDIGGGIFYTGRKDLAAGLQFLVRRFAVVPEVNVSWSTVLTQFGLRYYF